MRDYIPGNIKIDGRNIPCRIFTALDYLIEKGIVTLDENDDYEDSFEEFMNKDNGNEIYDLITEILALKQSYYLMRRVSYSCGTLSEGLLRLKNSLVYELKDKYNFEFDEEFVGYFR